MLKTWFFFGAVMSMLPNIVGPILQAPQQANNAAQIRDTERNQQTNAGQAQAKAVEAAAESVGTADGDAQVDAETGGAGSQGRAFHSDSEDLREEDQSQDVTLDDEGNPHLDIQA